MAARGRQQAKSSGVEVLLGAWLLRLVKQAGSGGAAWCLVVEARQAEQRSGGAAWCLVVEARLAGLDICSLSCSCSCSVVVLAGHMEALISLGSISALDVAIVIAIVLIVRWAFVYA